VVGEFLAVVQRQGLPQRCGDGRIPSGGGLADGRRVQIGNLAQQQVTRLPLDQGDGLAAMRRKTLRGEFDADLAGRVGEVAEHRLIPKKRNKPRSALPAICRRVTRSPVAHCRRHVALPQ